MKKNYIHICIQLCFSMLITLILVKGCYSNTHQIKGLTKARLSTSECKLIKHPLGASCIPLQPQRIIPLDQTMMPALLALDLKPIAATQPKMAGSIIPKLGRKGEGIVSLGKDSQPNIGKMVQLKPDLILGFVISDKEYKLFSQIAPTIRFNYIQTAWKDALLRIAKITDKSGQAQKILEQYQQRIQELPAVVNNQLAKTTVSISRFYAGKQVSELRTKYSFPDSLLTEVGIRLPEI